MIVSEMVSKILTFYAAAKGNPYNDIAVFIESTLKDDPQRFRIMEQLISIFGMDPESAMGCDEVVSKEEYQVQVLKQKSVGADLAGDQGKHEPVVHSREENEKSRDIFKLLLGRDVSSSGLSDLEMMNRMAECLDAIFSQLNEILAAINSPLTDVNDVTIRYVIKEHMVDGNDLNTVKEQIHQIKKAYLLTQESFQSASRSLVEKLLAELSPDAMVDGQCTTFKPGFLKKAEGFKMFQVKYERCFKWFKSNRFNHDLLNEFEKEYFNRLHKKKEEKN